MISISKLLCGQGAEGDGLRYDDPDVDIEQIREEKQKRPVVVWNTTRRCNLYCEYCYAGADLDPAQGEPSTAEAKGLIDDLVAYDVPALLFSGGEPFAREDLVELVDYATDAGIRAVLSTNGTLITEEKVRAFRDAGLSYAGVSVDGLEERNDCFRGKDGAFDVAIRGIENCFSVGLKTGPRYTITEHNAVDMEDVVDLLYDAGVDRSCFYHLDYGGRGGDIADADLDDEAQRRAVRRLFDMTREYHAEGEEIETPLVGNYVDSAYVVEYAEEELGRDHAERIHRYLRVNGGDLTGERVADVDYRGDVYLTQFWQGYSLGNVRDRPFGDIWDDESNPLFVKLREREEHLTGKCATCQYQDVCRGSSRFRSLAATGELFGPDPQCYLTLDERGVGVDASPGVAD